MATKYFMAGGVNSNYTDNTNWSTTSSAGPNNTTAPTASDAVILDAGSPNCTLNGTSPALSFDASLYTNTITHNGVALNVAGNLTLPVSGTGTYTALSGSTIAVNGTCTFKCNGQLIRSFTANSVAVTLGTDVTYQAITGGVFSLGTSGASLNMNGFKITGNSATNRVLIPTGTLGSPRTITNATSTSFNNVDFRDISFTTAGALDLTNGGVNSIGDCGGNSASGGTLTMTTSATQTWANGGVNNNWSTVGNWGAGRVPLPQDDVNANGQAGAWTITADMPRLGRDISFASASGTPTFQMTSISNTIYGSLDLTNVSTFSHTQSSTFESQRRSGTQTLKSAGKTIFAFTVHVYGSTLQLSDALICSSNIGLASGTFDTNSKSVQSISANNSGTVTRAWSLGTTTWTLTASTAGSGWDMSAGTSGLTVSSTNSTVVFSDTGANKKRYSSLANTFNNIQTPSGSGGLSILTSNTFNSMTINPNSLVTFNQGTTQTITGSITATGSAGNLITLNATAGTPPILNYTGSGKVNLDYLNIQGVNVTPISTWYYGTHSVDGLGVGFNGTSGSVTSGNGASKNQLFGATSFSVEGWIIPRGIGESSAGVLVSKNSVAGGYQLRLNTGNVLLAASRESSTDKITTTTTTISYGVLHHLVSTWTSGGAWKIYLDGTECAYSGTPGTMTTPDDDSALSLPIGNDLSDSRTFDGQIYLVRIYRNVALTAGNVTTLYNGGVLDKTMDNAVTQSATQTWLLNEGTGNTTSVQGDTGTITSPAAWINTGWNSGVGISARNLALLGVG